MDEGRSDAWPDWGEPLRPDDVARARMRRGIRERSAGLLARRRGATWRVLEAWAGHLTPLAAAVAVLCMWAAAHDASGGPAPRPGTGGVATASGGQARAPGALVSEIGPQGEQVVQTAFLTGL